jgi:hypothetical protein
MKSVAKVYQFAKSLPGIVYNAIIEVVENTGNQTYEWGYRNQLAQQILLLTSDSPSATQCLDKLTNFIAADGWQDEKAAVFQANPKQTANELLDELAPYEATFETFALLVRQDIKNPSIVSSVYLIEADKLTKRTDGSFLYNPHYLNQVGWKKGNDVIYAPWDADEKNFNTDLKRQLKENDGKQRGRILYVYNKKPGSAQHYANPGYYSASYDIATDAQLARQELKASKKGLDISAIIRTPPISRKPERGTGDTDDESRWSGESAYEAWVREIKKFTGEEGDNSSSIMHIENEVPDNPIEVTTFNPLANATDITIKRDGIAKRVFRAFGVPTVLGSLFDGGGIGDTKKIYDELSLFNSSLKKRKNRIEAAFKLLFPDLEWQITTLNPITYIPTEVMAKLTDDELRAMADLPPLEKAKAGDVESIIARLNTMSPLVATKVLEAMDKDEQRALIGLPPQTDEQKAASQPVVAPPNENKPAAA